MGSKTTRAAEHSRPSLKQLQIPDRHSKMKRHGGSLRLYRGSVPPRASACNEAVTHCTRARTAMHIFPLPPCGLRLQGRRGVTLYSNSFELLYESTFYLIYPPRFFRDSKESASTSSAVSCRACISSAVGATGAKIIHTALARSSVARPM